MATQKRIFEGAKTEMKISKGKNPKPYLHKIFNVTFTDDDFIQEYTDAYGNPYKLVNPTGVAKLRSVFIFNTKRKNTLSVMIVWLIPKYNAKGMLITENQKAVFCVNPVTKNVWKRQNNSKFNSPIDSYVPAGWTKDEWTNNILEAIS